MNTEFSVPPTAGVAATDSASPKIPARPARKTLLLTRFPGRGSERQECVDWMLNLVMGYANSPDIELLRPIRVNDTPAPMIRNQAVQIAQDHKVDLLLMVDDDMEPDYLYKPGSKNHDPRAKPFVSEALKFIKTIDEPAIIAAPYVGPPPEEPVYVFNWKWKTQPGKTFAANLEMIDRDIASQMAGIGQVAALPTGLMLFDMRVFDILPHPYFYYEATDNRWVQKATTEDVAFSRDCALVRIPIYCAWDSWAAHIKTYRCLKPQREGVEVVNARLREIVAKGHSRDDRVESLNKNPDWPDGLPVRTDNRSAEQILPLDDGTVRDPMPFCGIYARKKDGGRQEAEGEQVADRRGVERGHVEQAPAAP